MPPEGTQGTNSETPIPEPRPTIGQPFNPWRQACGFYPPDVIGRNTDLKLTDGQKRLYERGVRWAGRNGVFWYGFATIAGALGKSVRQVKDDMATLEAKGLMEHVRRRRQSNLYRFLWHPVFEVQSTALQENHLEVQDSILEVQDSVILKVQPTALELCPSELRTLNPVKSDGEADYSLRIEKRDAQAGHGSRADNTPKIESPENHQADNSSAKTAGQGNSDAPGSEGPRPEPAAVQREWTDEDVEAVSEFLSENLPQDLEEWPGGRTAYAPPDWLIRSLMDAGLGADRAEVLKFLQAKISTGWNPPNWKAYLAVVRHEFERRQNRVQGRRWSDSDLAIVRGAVKKYMEDDEPLRGSNTHVNYEPKVRLRSMCLN